MNPRKCANILRLNFWTAPDEGLSHLPSLLDWLCDCYYTIGPGVVKGILKVLFYSAIFSSVSFVFRDSYQNWNIEAGFLAFLVVYWAIGESRKAGDGAHTETVKWLLVLYGGFSLLCNAHNPGTEDHERLLSIRSHVEDIQSYVDSLPPDYASEIENSSKAILEIVGPWEAEYNVYSTDGN